MKRLSTVPKWLRIVLPSLIIVVWLTLGGIGGPYFGKISEVTTNDQASFLPARAESTELSAKLEAFQDEKTLPALVAFEGNGLLTADEIASIQTATRELGELSEATGVSPPIISEDGEAAFAVVNAASTVEYKEFARDIRTSLEAANLPVDFKITGPVGFLNDLAGAFAGIDGLLLGVALAVVFVILLIVYRSPLLPVLVLMTSVFALAAAILIVFYLAKADIIAVNGQVQGILFILVIGAATDYSLLFVSRYREELLRKEKTYQAILAGLKGSIEPILAAGGTVIAGLLCLLLSDLNSNKALGPVGAIGILVAMTSALTLLPSLLLPFGRAVFWPRLPKFSKADTEEHINQKGIWARASRFVAKYPRRIWIGTTLVLLIAAVGIVGLKADGIAQSEFVLGTSEARDGQAIIDKHFPGGSGTPTQVTIKEAAIEDAVAVLEKDSDVASVSARANNSPSGSVPLGALAEGSPFARITPTIVDGTVLLEVTLNSNADSLEAQATVQRIRDELHAIDSEALVGGTSATQLDTRLAAQHDQRVVIPAILIIITIILMVLLRSILAPILLLLTTVLSFAATLGVSALVFNGLFGFPGADPTIILYGFVFLVALGIDYNIFLMTRVREESILKGTRKGVLIGLIVTGGVITSAGIVLAATFAALAVIPILFLAQLAFIVAFGVLLDTIVVRSLLVPALVRDIGGKIWWPARHKRDR